MLYFKLFISILIFFSSTAQSKGLGEATINDKEKPIFTAVYKGKHTGINITMTRTLSRKDAKNYRLLSYAKNFLGSITDDSKFTIEEGTVRPQHYRYLRKVFGKTSDQNLYFDWKSKHASFRRSDKPQKNADYEIPEHALETALYQLKLQQELSAGKTQFHFTFAKDSRIKELEFKVIEPAQYTLKNKVYDAIEVERINQPDNRKTNIILIPALNFQIAQIIHIEEDGSSYKVQLSDYQGDALRISEFYQSIKENGAEPKPAI